MPVKTPVKKTTKTAHKTKGLKPVKKTAKKITLDDLLRSQDEAWKAIRETEKTLKKSQDEA